jgi:hypothetical protein
VPAVLAQAKPTATARRRRLDDEPVALAVRASAMNREIAHALEAAERGASSLDRVVSLHVAHRETDPDAELDA